MKCFLIDIENSGRNPNIPFEYVKVIAEQRDNPVVSLKDTVIKILQENNTEPVFIMESDVLFTKDFTKDKLDNIVNKLSNTTVDCIFTGFFSRNLKIENIEGFLSNDLQGGTQGVIYFPSALQKIKDIDSKYVVADIDFLINISCVKVFIYPFFTIQKNYTNSIHGTSEGDFLYTINLINNYLNENRGNNTENTIFIQ